MIIRRKLGPKGQLVLPKDIRELLGVSPGEEIFIEINNKNEIIIKPKQNPVEFLNSFYSTSKKLTKKIDIEQILDQEYE